MIDRTSFALANLTARRSRNRWRPARRSHPGGASLSARSRSSSVFGSISLLIKSSHRRALSHAALTVKLPTMPSARRVGFFGCIR